MPKITSVFYKGGSRYTKEKYECDIVVYKTSKEILDSAIEIDGCKKDRVPYNMGKDGVQEKAYNWVLKDIRKVGFWAFKCDDNSLHFWISKRTKPEKIMYLIGHEFGHIVLPQHISEIKEEAKAEKYGIAAEFAYVIYQECFKEG